MLVVAAQDTPTTTATNREHKIDMSRNGTTTRLVIVPAEGFFFLIVNERSTHVVGWRAFAYTRAFQVLIDNSISL